MTMKEAVLGKMCLIESSHLLLKAGSQISLPSRQAKNTSLHQQSESVDHWSVLICFFSTLIMLQVLLIETAIVKDQNSAGNQFWAVIKCQIVMDNALAGFSIKAD